MPAALKPAGVLGIDAGAVGALQRGRSLLPAGVVTRKGSFERGDAVDVADAEGRVIARGLSAYSSADVQRIMGRRSSGDRAAGGFRGRDEIVHRDDLVLRKDGERIRRERAHEHAGSGRRARAIWLRS